MFKFMAYIMINTVVIVVCYLLRGEKLEYVMLK